jgi:hypothetical protein
MHQNEIDKSVGGVIGGTIVGLVLAVALIARYPLRTLAVVFLGFVFYGGSLLVNAGVEKYDAYVAEIELEEAREKEVLRARQSALNNKIYAIKQGAFWPVWRRVGLLSELEKMEYQGNQRVKKFREDFTIPADVHPDPAWLNFESSIAADKAAGDENFTRTRAQAEYVVAKLATADRYLKVVEDNKIYFAGGRSHLLLPGEFLKEFGKATEQVKK